MQESKEALERLRRMGAFEAQDFDITVGLLTAQRLAADPHAISLTSTLLNSIIVATHTTFYVLILPCLLLKCSKAGYMGHTCRCSIAKHLLIQLACGQNCDVSISIHADRVTVKSCKL